MHLYSRGWFIRGGGEVLLEPGASKVTMHRKSLNAGAEGIDAVHESVRYFKFCCERGIL